MVRPSAAKTTTSARLASEVWNRAISSRRGTFASPRSTPATKTAMKPEPCAVAAIP